jgi:hypothetical protein
MDPVRLVERLATRIHLKKPGGSVVHHVVHLKNLLKSPEARVVRGWAVVQETLEACPHYWVEFKGLKLDVALEVARRHNPDAQLGTMELVEDVGKLSGFKFIDETKQPTLFENLKLYSEYASGPDAFKLPKELLKLSV